MLGELQAPRFYLREKPDITEQSWISSPFYGVPLEVPFAFGMPFGLNATGYNCSVVCRSLWQFCMLWFPFLQAVCNLFQRGNFINWMGRYNVRFLILIQHCTNAVIGVITTSDTLHKFSHVYLRSLRHSFGTCGPQTAKAESPSDVIRTGGSNIEAFCLCY